MSQTPEDLKKKIVAAKATDDSKKDKDKASDQASKENSGARMAARAATDMVSAVVVGGALGYALDQWLNTTPWFMIIMFFLGSVAGFINIYRSQTGQDYQVGFRPKKDTKDDETKHGGK